jgi:hypothetical protein
MGVQYIYVISVGIHFPPDSRITSRTYHFKSFWRDAYEVALETEITSPVLGDLVPSTDTPRTSPGSTSMHNAIDYHDHRFCKFFL